MAETVGKINGDSFLLEINDIVVAHSIDASLEVSQESIDTTTKDSSRWVDKINGNRSYSGSGSGLFAFDPDGATELGAVDLIDLIMGDTTPTFKLTNSNAGDVEYSGSIVLTNVSLSSPQNAAVGYDFSFEGVGALVKTVIT